MTLRHRASYFTWNESIEKFNRDLELPPNLSRCLCHGNQLCLSWVQGSFFAILHQHLNSVPWWCCTSSQWWKPFCLSPSTSLPSRLPWTWISRSKILAIQRVHTSFQNPTLKKLNTMLRVWERTGSVLRQSNTCEWCLSNTCEWCWSKTRHVSFQFIKLIRSVCSKSKKKNVYVACDCFHSIDVPVGWSFHGKLQARMRCRF